MEKASHESYNIEMFAPILKSAKGKYFAVLSDTSIDRDEERVSKEALEDVAKFPGYIAGLMDHENKVLNQVAQWTNVKIQDIDGHIALLAEPKFFKSNPNATIIQGMLDEGAKIGISIGAIVKDYEDKMTDGKEIRTFTKLELLEASFVAIPSNRHGRVMAVAKSFNTEVVKMEQKDIDAAIEKAESKLKVAFKKEMELKDAEIAELKKESEKEESEEEESEEEESKESEAEKKVKMLEKEVKDLKTKSFEKQVNGHDSEDDKGLPAEEVEKILKTGKLPIGRY